MHATNLLCIIARKDAERQWEEVVSKKKASREHKQQDRPYPRPTNNLKANQPNQPDINPWVLLKDPGG